MKQSLFSRMSPTNKAGGNAGENKQLARTQASSNNVGLGSQTGVTSPTGQRTLGSGMNVGRLGKSPFREAMQKGVLSGAGLLTF